MAPNLKVLVAVKAGAGGGERDDVPLLGLLPGHTDRLFQVRRVEDPEAALFPARNLCDSRLDLGAGGPGEDKDLYFIQQNGARGA